MAEEGQDLSDEAPIIRFKVVVIGDSCNDAPLIKSLAKLPSSVASSMKNIKSSIMSQLGLISSPRKSRSKMEQNACNYKSGIQYQMINIVWALSI